MLGLGLLLTFSESTTDPSLVEDRTSYNFFPEESTMNERQVNMEGPMDGG